MRLWSYPAEGAYSAFPDSLAGLRGTYFREDGRQGNGKGREGKRRKGRGRKGEERGLCPSSQNPLKHSLTKRLAPYSLNIVQPRLCWSYALQASRIDRHASKCCLAKSCFELSFHWLHEDLFVVADLQLFTDCHPETTLHVNECRNTNWRSSPVDGKMTFVWLPATLLRVRFSTTL